jgi:repressor LexA
MHRTLSIRQEAILGFISIHLSEYPFAPTVREIQSGLHISSPSVVEYNLNILERQGYIKTWPGRARAIEVLKLHEGGG